MGLFSFWRSARRPVEVVLYTRAGCGLCEDMKADMARAGVEGRYVLREVDVDGERELKRRYGLRLPVLAIDGRERFEARLDPAEFARAVKTAQRSPVAGERS